MDEVSEAIRAAARAALPRLEGEVRVEGLGDAVEVRRDRWGVPHISAAGARDLWIAQGYVTASDRLFQIELAYRLGLGRLSELFGELTLPLDRFIRTVGWNRSGATVARASDARSVEMAEAFATGARAWLEDMPAPPPEYGILGDATPWLPEPGHALEAGLAAGALMAWSLARGWDTDLLRAEVAERLGVEAAAILFPGGTVAPLSSDDPRLAMLAQAFRPPAGQGSNNWVVSGARTATGAPLLANDPHLVVGAPAAWYEVHLTAPGIDVAGVALPFSPGVIVGHNDRVAWGFTNTEADVQDLYLERVSEDGRAAEYLGRWEPMTLHEERIEVRGRPEPAVVEVRETRHGPLLDSYLVGVRSPQVVEGGVRRTYALRWVGATHLVEPSTVWDLDTAQDWDTFREAVSRWHCPGQNMVYADVDGHIGLQVTGRYPRRRAGDGTLPVPGWTDEWEWEGWIPFEDLHHEKDPERGVIVTANNRIDEDLGGDYLPSFRFQRIAHLLAETVTHTRDTFAAIQTDTVSIPAREITRELLGVEPANARQEEALALLGAWDHDMRADSAAAAIYAAWSVRIARRILLPLMGEELFIHYYARRQASNAFQYLVLPQLLADGDDRWFGEPRDDLLRDALDTALGELEDRLGEDTSAWRWGALHRARFAGRLAAIPGLGDVFTAADLEHGGDEQTVNQGAYEPGEPFEVAVAASWRMVVDLSDLDATAGVLPPGQSGNPASPHASDQAELWASGELRSMPFGRDAVEGATRATLRLRP